MELCPADADQLDIAARQEVIVESARGSLRARAFVTPTVRAGLVFIAMHDAETNRLTHPSFDPYSRQPSYEHAVVSVRTPSPPPAAARRR